MKQTEFFFHLLQQSAHLYEYWTDAATYLFVLKFLLDEPTFPLLISSSHILHIATVESPIL